MVNDVIRLGVEGVRSRKVLSRDRSSTPLHSMILHGI